MSDKSDPRLGNAIRRHLTNMGVETPIVEAALSADDAEKISIIEGAFRTIWETLGMDLTDDSLAETPKRMAKMYVREIYSGLRSENFPKCTTVENRMGYDEMVVERRITVQSNCEHHGVVIDGYATVAYIPDTQVLGLSKINRIVQYFSKRPQIQERLTEQIHAALCYILNTDNVAVVVNAKHYCVSARGVEDTSSRTATSKLSGCFKTDPAVRSEFMGLAANS